MKINNPKHELLVVAAEVARRRYLPDLENCRTIRQARERLQKYDTYHADLALRLKQIHDALPYGLELQPLDSDICINCDFQFGEHSREAYSDGKLGWKWKKHACPIGETPFDPTETFAG